MIKKRVIKKKKISRTILLKRNKKNLNKNLISKNKYLVLILSLLIITLIIIHSFQNNYFHLSKTSINSNLNQLNKEKSVRDAIVAGQFYPAEEDNLNLAIQTYLDMAPDKNLSNIRAIIVPHAGYIYSGEIAGYSYKQLVDKKYDNVFIFGQSHHVYFDEASILNVTHYSTPLGEIPVSYIADKLLEQNKFYTLEEVHNKEHSIEVQIPFIQMTQPDSKIIPVIFGQVVDIDYMSKIFEKYISNNTLFIISTDLSHYHDYETARFFDNETITNLLEKNQEGLKYSEACARNALLILNKIAIQNNWKPILLDYRNSGDTSGKNDSVVGYTSIIYTSEKLDNIVPATNFYNEISDEDRIFLLKLARDTIRSMLNQKKPKLPDESKLSDVLKSKRGCFVTLEKKEDLRGCIGSIPPASKLYECVLSNAMNAAFRDSRFTKLDLSELDDVDIEISKLSIPKKLEYSTPDELLDLLNAGVDGVILKNKWTEATFLPTIWDLIPDKKMFLSELCEKGNMDKNCWKDPKIIVETYQAEVFSEKDYK